ncbi:MAG: hypothetical protein JXA72_04355 [Bacteroidales bacterium]|nr:hypothetical protein [Bacteroidales bacterium]
MNYRHTLEAALENLHEIEELISGFAGSEKIPAVEIDLVLQKMRNMYELMLMVRKEPASGEVSEVAEKHMTSAAAPADPSAAAPAPAPATATATAAAPTASAAPATTAAAAAAAPAAPVAPAAAAAAAPAAPVAPAASSAPATVASKEKPSKRAKTVETLADQFQGGATLHESLHNKISNEEDTLAHAKPVTDLLSAIGINDRYTFIRELFNGDSGKFESAIKFLNDATSFNDAYNYMLLYFNWDMESEPVQLLLDMIRRKFIKRKNE